MPEPKTLTRIATLCRSIFESLPKGTPESNKAFEAWRLASEVGDARTLSDEPTVAAEKRAAKKSTKPRK